MALCREACFTIMFIGRNMYRGMRMDSGVGQIRVVPNTGLCQR